MKKKGNVVRDLAQYGHILRGLSVAQIDAIVESCEKITLEKDAVLFKEGSKGNDIYILLAGSMKILKGKNSISLACISPIKIIGEIAMILNLRRTATVVAESYSMLFKLSRRKFDALLADDKDMAIQLYRNLCNILCERLASSNIHMQETLLQKD